ncbi:hypothetical protein P9222_00800 [Paenibacillus amylolyticus]|nr:hypothetical protein [Paenibacillus amylolyticus]WFR63021.1 hypothetical protein P9222_00800 [Paenibacillus amylolyticus]
MNDEPNAVNRIDLRQVTIYQLGHILEGLNQDNPEQTYRIVFITNSAFVTGDLTDLDEENLDEQPKSVFQQVMSKTLEFRNESLLIEEQRGDNARVVNDSALFTLKNVTIRPFSSNGSHKVDELLLFTDAITGFTISNSQEL